MKYIKFILASLLAAGVLFTSCKEKEGGDDTKSVGTFTQAQLTEAIADMYAAWEQDTKIPETVNVGDKALTKPQYLYAMAKLIVNIKDGKKEDIKVLSFKAAGNPDRDSYDKEEIAVVNGPAVGSETEDLANIASRIIAAATEKGQIPNQTLFTRSAGAIAYSTNRATVTFARAIAAYKADGKFPEKVSTEYLSAAATLKAFAQQYVTLLDVWKNTIGTVDADASHCTANGNAWTNVHFLPIPASGGYDTAPMYGDEYKPYWHVEVDGTAYSAAQAYVIAMKGILDMITLEGSGILQKSVNEPVHTLGNGKKLTEPLPQATEEWVMWGMYPYYENTTEYPQFTPEEVGVDWFWRDLPWRFTRNTALGKIGNFLCYSADGKLENYIIQPPYHGTACAIRCMLMTARFYKFLLDNNITENVYDAVKDEKFSSELYDRIPDPITVDEKKLTFSYAGETKPVYLKAEESWTSEAPDWILIDPASGDATTGMTVNVTAAANDGDLREGTVVFKINDEKQVSLKVSQAAVPSTMTIKDFAKEYVKLLDIWRDNVKTMDMLNGENAGEQPIPDAHYIPKDTKITVGTSTYNVCDCVEIAERSYLLLRGYDGNNETAKLNQFPKLEGSTMSGTTIPPTHGTKWGSYPYNEGGTTSVGGATTGNGGYLKMGDPTNPSTGQNLVKTDILDNFAQRHVNWPLTHDGVHSNMCSYSGNQLAGYFGCFSSWRAVITYAFFFQYMLDNNLEDAMSIPADQTFTTDLFGETLK